MDLITWFCCLFRTLLPCRHVLIQDYWKLFKSTTACWIRSLSVWKLIWKLSEWHFQGFISYLMKNFLKYSLRLVKNNMMVHPKVLSYSYIYSLISIRSSEALNEIDFFANNLVFFYMFFSKRYLIKIYSLLLFPKPFICKDLYFYIKCLYRLGSNICPLFFV